MPLREVAMDIFDFAMKMEKDGEHYYRELDRSTRNAGLKSILEMLIEAEVRHYRLFENMKAHKAVEVGDAPILKDVRNIFEQMKQRKDFEVDVSQKDLYLKAQEVEAKSRAFYLEQAEKMQDAAQKTAFEKIAAEEQRHYVVIENVLSFISRPETWLEDAEWYHLEDY
jgi:rubrerythrin